MSSGPLVIVGDALLDRDVTGHAGRLCPDAPVPVVEDAAERLRPGGAALAALLAARDAGEIVLIAPFGGDPASAAARDLLPGTVTVIPLPLDGGMQEKTRIRAAGQTLLRVDRPAGTPGRAGRRAAEAIMDAGAVLVSDYGHGTSADPRLREAVAARAGRVPLVWDPHPRGTAPVAGTWLATPNGAEAARACGLPDPRGAVLPAAAAAERLLGSWPVRSLAVTLGGRGALLASAGQAPLAIPAAAIQVSDPCGAGDQFAAAAAAALRDGATMSEAVTAAVAAATGYLAGGGVHGLPGGPAPGARWSGEPSPAEAAEAIRAAGGVLVAAGGCFDVLHAGHVSMLRAARSLGDRLVVCMNSDDSVRRLKGPGRPLVPAADRAAVLAALDCVDQVAIFEEDTPERLLRQLRPAIWVKGGDYDGSDLPEAAALREWGGRVVTVPYLSGRSTSGIASAAARAG
ncbi:MAG: bifunctional heptose 7-phosphate kinase/heptose 1-phosphate adenyltransferase [Streptosporangiaceae bacterium]|nr:bifunctional heptose 7-phosphate kinase/heptose 1-phosphate adenyltransferase [Streptosporangiaceae bacterium]